jgi:hypothetical protein
MGEKIDEEVLAVVVRGGVGGPSMVALEDFPDELDQVGVLPEHEDVQVMPLAAHFLSPDYSFPAKNPRFRIRYNQLLK